MVGYDRFMSEDECALASPLWGIGIDPLSWTGTELSNGGAWSKPNKAHMNYTP